MHTRGLTFLVLLLLGGGGWFVAMSGVLAAGPRSSSGDALQPPGEREARAQRLLREPCSAERRAGEDATRAPVAAVGLEVAYHARVDAAVSRLGDALTGEPFDRGVWERRTRAVAGSLGARAVPVLQAFAAGTERTVEEHIAAAELLRVLQAVGGERQEVLPPPALRALRTTVHDADRPESHAVAAGRALSALGEPADRAHFLAMLSGDDGRQKSRAAWCLRSAVEYDAPLGLLELGRGEEMAELALGTLDGWIRAQEPERLDHAFVATVQAELSDMLRDPTAPPAARRRALSALSALPARDAPAAIRALLTEAETSDELRRRGLTALAELGTLDSVLVLEEFVVDPQAVGCAPLALAEVCTRLGADSGVRPHVDDLVRETLLRTVRDSPLPEERRRALFALGRAGTRDAADAMAQALCTDSASSVRAAAVWGLARDPGLMGHVSALEHAADHDDSPQVRRLARHALDGLGSAPSAGSGGPLRGLPAPRGE